MKSKNGQTMYIIQATVEYLIALVVQGSFLATVSKQIGLSDSIIGVISSFISLGCLFQMISVFLKIRNVKRFVLSFSIVNQILFLLLYVIPIFNINKTLKCILFSFAIFSAYFVYYVAHPNKINWFMSLVDNNKRGKFTANKEIISLIAGMAFSMGMGTVVDYFKERNMLKTAFLVSAMVILLLSVIHTMTVIFTPTDENVSKAGEVGLLDSIKDLFSNKDILKIITVLSLWNIALYCFKPFLSTYELNELGFSLKYISLIAIIGSIVRILLSRRLGTYADKHSFAKMLTICFSLYCIGLLFIPFSNAQNGKITLMIYTVFSYAADAGINSALINLVFDYVKSEQRADSLAICQSFSGALGFLATLAASPVVSKIQKNGNTVFGVKIYAQQLLSVISLIITISIIIFLCVAFNKKEKARS